MNENELNELYFHRVYTSVFSRQSSVGETRTIDNNIDKTLMRSNIINIINLFKKIYNNDLVDSNMSQK